MRRITGVEQLTDAIVDGEIHALLHAARADVANRKAQLVLGGEFEPSEEDLSSGPMGQKMRRVFDYARGLSDEDRMKVAEACEEVLEFLWSSMFAGHYQIPDAFWESPLGFAVYEVIGRVADVPESRELTSIQAAKYLGVGQPELERLTREGKVAVSRTVGSHARYRVGDLKSAKASLDPAS